MSKNKTRTKDKYRVVYNDTQRIELENEFRLNEYIAIPRKQEIAHKLQLSERQIKIWFQNRRAKKRKQQKRRQTTTTSSTTTTTTNVAPANSTASSAGQITSIKRASNILDSAASNHSHSVSSGALTSGSVSPPNLAPGYQQAASNRLAQQLSGSLAAAVAPQPQQQHTLEYGSPAVAGVAYHAAAYQPAGYQQQQPAQPLAAGCYPDLSRVKVQASSPAPTSTPSSASLAHSNSLPSSSCYTLNNQSPERLGGAYATNQSQFHHQPAPDLPGLDAQLAANAPHQPSHPLSHHHHHQHQHQHQPQPHQQQPPQAQLPFPPTFVEHHNQELQQAQQLADHQRTRAAGAVASLGYQTASQAAPAPAAAELAGAHHHPTTHQAHNQTHHQYHQHQHPQQYHSNHHQYAGVSASMHQHNHHHHHHHQLMIEQHYANAIAAGSDQQSRSTGSPNDQTIIGSIDNPYYYNASVDAAVSSVIHRQGNLIGKHALYY